MGSVQASIRAKVERRSAGEPGSRARVLLGDSGTELDITGALIGAIAHSLWQARGGDSMTNWADAETVLDQLLDQAPKTVRSEIKPPTPPRAPVAAAGRKPGARR